MPDDERDELLSSARTRPLTVGESYSIPDESIESVFFPISGTLSLIANPDDTQRVDAATIGREGAANTVSALGPRLAVQELIGQIEGELIEIDVESFQKGVERNGTFADVIFGYHAALLAEASISAACNALHHADQRCARWLLTTHDHVDSDTFVLKQEFLAFMLGAQRPTVSIAASRLRQAGYISYARGTITVLDRVGLEEAACSCYESIRRAYSRLVPLR